MERIQNIWNELKKNKNKDESSPFIKRDFRKFDSSSPVYFMIAKSSLTNECGILVQSSKDNFLKISEKPMSEYFKLEEYAGTSSDSFLWFHLTKENLYEDRFEIICSDIINKSLNALDEKNCILNFVNGIKDWQEFLRQKKNQLSESKLKGLFAELIFIKEIMIEKCKINAPIKNWKPHENTHDFLIKNISLEIKSTTSSPIKKIKVNSLKQFDESLTKCLILVLIQLKENEGNSLPDIVDHIRTFLKNESSENYYLFESKLIKEGYFDEHKSHYQNRKFNPSAYNYFEIRDDFPRLRDKDLKEMGISGIVDASYEISYNSFENKKISEKKIIELIQ